MPPRESPSFFKNIKVNSSPNHHSDTHNRPPTHTELHELLAKSDSSYSRLPQAALNKLIKEFYATIKETNHKPTLAEEEPEPKKRPKLSPAVPALPPLAPVNPEIIS
jgi:hypothetical protein